MNEKKWIRRRDILINAMFSERWETEEQMYSSMAYHLAEEKAVAENQLAFGLANCNQDQEMYDVLNLEIEPQIEKFAEEFGNLPNEELNELYLESREKECY